jgi:hypothetical protein
MLAASDEAAVALAQAQLSLPSDVLRDLRELVDAPLDMRGDL